MKYLLTLILFMTTNIFSSTVFLDTEIIKRDLWLETATDSPMLSLLDTHKTMGIVVYCFAGSVYVRQINHGEFTPLKYRFTAQGSSASLSYGCDQYLKNLEKTKRQIEKQNKKNK